MAKKKAHNKKLNKQKFDSSNKNLEYIRIAQILAIFLLISSCIQYTHRINKSVLILENSKSNQINIREELFPSPTFNITASSKIQTDRITQLRKFCKFPIEPQDKNLLSQNKELFHYLTRSNKTDEFRLIEETRSKSLFCEIPKAGSTNLKKIILQIQFPNTFGQLSFDNIIRPHGNLHSSKADAIDGSANGYRYLLDSSNLTLILDKFSNGRKILFTRHPFDRLLSAYRDKILPTVLENDLYSRIIKTLKKSSNKQVLQNLAAGGFHEFVEYAILRQKVRNGDFSGYKLEKESTLFDNGAKTRHWNSIIDTCHICKIEWFFIGKLESFEDDFELLMDALGLSGAYSLPNQLKSKNEEEVKKRIARFKFYYGKLPKETITRLYHAYEQDFEAFGYSVPEFLKE